MKETADGGEGAFPGPVAQGGAAPEMASGPSGIPADGGAGTACVIDEEAERAGPPLPKDKPLTQTQQRALRLLGRAIEEAGSVPLASKHTPSGVLCVAENVWRQYCYQGAISVGDQDAKRMAFKRAAEALVVAGRVGKWSDWVWLA